MRKGLTVEASHGLHRRRGRSLIVAAIAVLVVGTAASFLISGIYASDRREAGNARFQAADTLQRDRIQDTIHSYRRLTTVAQGFFQVVDPTSEQFIAFTNSLDLSGARPAAIALEFIPRPAAPDASVYPVSIVAPRAAAPGLLGANIAASPDVRGALRSVARSGDIVMTPPVANTYQQLRMQLVAPVERHGQFVGWVGVTLDSSILATEVLGEPETGLATSISWSGADDHVLGTVSGPGAGAEEPVLFQSVENIDAEGSPFTVTMVASPAFDPQATGFPWIPFLVGVLLTMAVSSALWLMGRSRIAALDLATRLGLDLAASEARAKAVMDSAVEAIVTTDAGGRIEWTNPAAESLFGWADAELSGRPVADLFPGLVTNATTNGTDRARADGEQMVEAKRKDGSTLPVDVTLARTAVGGDEIVTVIARDATIRKLHEANLEHQATHDPLTGLSNRKLFSELLINAVYRAERSRRPLAVLYLDLDGFKNVNDAFGHQAGDRVLVETGRRLESVIRPGDIVARIGGDEFVVLCENLTSPDDAEKIAVRIVQTVGKPVPVAAGVATATASVGIALGSLGESADSIVHRADEAMYRAKQEGKAGYRFATAIIG
jgi:diguanylate cyclase (GGDEF)-like protein/PAS domain S-box-containing protein